MFQIAQDLFALSRIADGARRLEEDPFEEYRIRRDHREELSDRGNATTSDRVPVLPLFEHVDPGR